MTLKISLWMDKRINYALVGKYEQARAKWSENFPDSGLEPQCQLCPSLAMLHDKLCVLKACTSFVVRWN